MGDITGKLGSGLDALKKMSGGTSLGAKAKKASKDTPEGRGAALRSVLSGKPNPKSKVGNRKPAAPGLKLGSGGAISGGGKL